MCSTHSRSVPRILEVGNSVSFGTGCEAILSSREIDIMNELTKYGFSILGMNVVNKQRTFLLTCKLHCPSREIRRNRHHPRLFEQYLNGVVATLLRCVKQETWGIMTPLPIQITFGLARMQNVPLPELLHASFVSQFE